MIWYLLEGFKALVLWTLEVIRSAGDSIIAAVLGVFAFALPDMAPHLATFSEYAAAMNYFFPLSETVTMGAAYGVLWSLVRGFRFAKSVIPTMGN